MLASLGSVQKLKKAFSSFVTSHQCWQLFGLKFDYETACTTEQMIGKERRGLSEGIQQWVGHSTNKECCRSLRQQFTKHKGLLVTQKRQTVFLNGLSCWVLKSGIRCKGRDSLVL